MELVLTIKDMETLIKYKAVATDIAKADPNVTGVATIISAAEARKAAIRILLDSLPGGAFSEVG